jgi:hypothetical protein
MHSSTVHCMGAPRQCERLGQKQFYNNCWQKHKILQSTWVLRVLWVVELTTMATTSVPPSPTLFTAAHEVGLAQMFVGGVADAPL